MRIYSLSTGSLGVGKIVKKPACFSPKNQRKNNNSKSMQSEDHH